MCDPRSSKFSQDRVVVRWVEALGDIAGPLLIQKVDASQDVTGIDDCHDVL